MTRILSILFVLSALHALFPTAQPDEPAIAFGEQPGRLEIRVGGEPFATYVYRDEAIPRPYFSHIHAPGGNQVTRNHPPVEGKDATDHADLHPGLWMAFGDLGGADFWRNKAAIRHAGFIERPKAEGSLGSFTVQNEYWAGTRKMCDETMRIEIEVRPSARLIRWDSTFTSDPQTAFGDQEEMGLGIRVATALAVKNGGTIRDSEGRVNEAQVWGRQARWARYSGRIDDAIVGMVLMPHPDNFRPSWFHARDYGFMAANPFGVHAFTKGEPGRVEIGPGRPLQLRFGVLIYRGEVDIDAEWDHYAAAGSAAGRTDDRQ
jgi:hypothetical protein